MRADGETPVRYIISNPDSPYYRTIDVLNSLAHAGATNVTFTADAEEP